jgi:hypothetical protein
LPAGPTQTCAFSVAAKWKRNVCWDALTPAEGTVVKYQMGVFFAGTLDHEADFQTTGLSYLLHTFVLRRGTEYDLRVRALIQVETRSFWTFYGATQSFWTKP